MPNEPTDSSEAARRRPFARPRYVVLALLLLATVLGANWLAFQCDDAYINYRYVRNLHDGLGLVWNPPPFQPVEGYGALLWILLLCATWSLFGVEPPDAANVLSIALGVLQFVLIAATALRLRRRDGSPVAVAIGLLTVAAITGNRTFLQWMTSGLETALFNLTFLGWVLLGFRARERRTTGWLLLWSLAAAAAALTRPDGLLLVAATVATASIAVVQRERSWRQVTIGLLPLLLAVAHVLWRRSFYGEWLPNTYYAKVVTAWPEAGARYFACFVIEHGVWLWLPLVLVWLVVEGWRAGRAVLPLLMQWLPALAAIGAVVFHCVYYTMRVGGDHFEYRVLSHLVPLGFLSAAAMVVRLVRGSLVPMLVIGSLWLASGVGWLHLASTSPMPAHGFRPVAPSLPAFVRPLAHWFDQQQAWLLFRNIGLRCSHHRILLARFQQDFPAPMWIENSPDPFPAYPIGAVGCSGWCLPNTVLLDLHGLNDWVIARTPVFWTAGPISSDLIRPIVAQANGNHDDVLDAAELRAAIGLLGGGTADDEAGDYLVSILMTIYAEEHPGTLTLREAEGMGDSLAGARSMAHERHPPPGYIEAFEPNVVVVKGVASVTPRSVPMTAERVRAIEAEWRAKVLAQKQ